MAIPAGRRAREEVAPQGEQKMTAERACTVLIVEDNGLFRQVLGDALRHRFPGLRVLEATDLDQGGVKLCEGRPDLVFLDIGLPDGNGLDLAEVIRRERPDAVVVVCTSHDLPEYRQAAEACGAHHFLPKDQMDWEKVGDLVELALAGRVPLGAGQAQGALP